MQCVNGVILKLKNITSMLMTYQHVLSKDLQRTEVISRSYHGGIVYDDDWC